MIQLKKGVAVATFAAALAVGAQAVTISLVSAGTFASTGATTFTQDESVLISHTGTLPSLTTLHVSTDTSTNMATATYNNGADTLVLDWTLTNTVYDSSHNISSTDGTWLYKSGTGQYAGLTGDGTFAVTLSKPDNNFASTSLAGTLAVPEPASVAVFAVGLIGLATRRKRK